MKKSVLILLSSFLLIYSCSDTKDEPNDDSEIDALTEKVKVNPEFEKSSPVATDVAIEVLKTPLKSGENVKLIATFEKGAIDDEFLAIMVGEKNEKLVLRDDGKGADDRKGDLKFSVFLEEDVDELKKTLEERREVLLAGGLPVDFVNRSKDRSGAEKIRFSEVKNFSSKTITPGKLQIIPKDILFGASTRSTPDAAKSLLITSTAVVEDANRTFNPCTNTGNANGVWTFGNLMREMASSSPGAIASDAVASTFVLDWLNTWMVPQTENGESLPARININNRIIQPWLNRSAADGAPAGQLLMKFAPFKLTAIVNRLDLRGNSGYGFSDAGEGRFVFCALDANCNPLEFNVIFEYGINKRSCASVKAFAQEWMALDGMVLGSAGYNNALEAITNQFAVSGTNPSKPNQNSINQIRTNENALTNPWELREFNLEASGSLEIVTVKMEPAVIYNSKTASNETQMLANFANTNEADILNNNYEIPLTFANPLGGTLDFLGGKSHTPFPPTGAVATGSNTPHHWDGTTSAPHLINNDNVRHILSLNTCSGCHGGETQTFFTHIDPAAFGVEAGLSGFLTGEAGRGIPGFMPIDADGNPTNAVMTVIDAANRPAAAPAQRGFNDLQRRAQDLQLLANSQCSVKFIAVANLLQFVPNKFEH